MNKKGANPGIFVAMGVVLLLIVVFVSGIVDIEIFRGGGSGNLIECDVKVMGTLGEADIYSYDCEIVNDCSISPLSIQPLGIFKQRGKLVLRTADKEDSVNYDVIRLFPTTTTYTLDVCSKETSGKLMLFDEDGTQIDTQKFDLK